jgi:hypothetical protein
MDKNPLIRKGIAVGIILLFVGITCLPTISAHDDTILSKAFSIPQKEDTASITVLEYKPDGTIGKSVMKMSLEQVVKLREELRDVKDLDTRLSIYKKHNLIPQNVTADTLRLGMEERAQKIYPEIERLQKLIANSEDPHFCINLNCEVSTGIAYGLRFLGGLSLITCILNGFNLFDINVNGPFIPSIDLFQVLFGYAGDFSAINGILPDCWSAGFWYAVFLLGCVGYFFKLTPIPNIFITTWCWYLGYSAAALCLVGAPYPE